MLYEKTRTKIIEICHEMVSAGFFMGTWGNVSARIENFIILTPSKVNYDIMQPEDLVIIDLQGNVIEGSRIPTSEKEVHRQIYLCRNDVQAIVHSHTAKAMSVSALPIPAVPCMTEEMSQLLGGEIPITHHYIPAEQHINLGLAAAEAIQDKNAVILRNHGGVACGKSLDEAVLSTCVLEKSCGIFLDISGQSFREIPETYVLSEHDRYMYRYGHEET